MKKLLSLVVAFTLFTGLTATAQEITKKADKNAPIIEFEEKVMDYGTIANGSDGQRIFKFKNTGKTPLIITRAKGSCGCTVPVWPKEPILPGKTAEMKVRYDTKRTGPFNKSVTVYSNASNDPVVVRIKGTVLAKEGDAKPTKPAKPAKPAKPVKPAKLVKTNEQG